MQAILTARLAPGYNSRAAGVRVFVVVEIMVDVHETYAVDVEVPAARTELATYLLKQAVVEGLLLSLCPGGEPGAARELPTKVAKMAKAQTKSMLVQRLDGW